MESVWFLAHIVGQRPPGLLSWLAAIVLFGGLAGVLLARGRLRQVCAILAIGGLAGTVVDMIQRSQPPARPNLLIRLVSPRETAARPLVVQVCGATRGDRPIPAVANGRYLLVRIDGTQVAEVHTPAVIVPVSLGRHHLFVAVTSPSHQEFRPPLAVNRDILVNRTESPSPLSACK